MIVKSIARAKVDIARIGYKDTVSYVNILLDESVRRTFCRLYFNRKVKYVAIFDVEKNDFVKHVIEKLDDIFNFSEQIIAAIEAIDKKA